MDKTELIKMAKNTVDISNKSSYITKRRVSVNFSKEKNECLKNTITIKPNEKILDNLFYPEYDCQVEVVNKSSYQCGKDELNNFSNVCILNFASATRPGGGFLTGSTAQEESLARISSLYDSLIKNKEMYEYNSKHHSGLYSDYMIYSPKVPFFKNEKNELLDKIELISIITSPAVNYNSGDMKNYEQSYIDKIMEKRIDKIFECAIKNREEVLVLGAFGCGVFKNNPEKVVDYFNKSLIKYKKYFKKIVFAVIENQKSDNYKIFKNKIKAE